MSALFPMFSNCPAAECLVVGGGAIAEGKVESLLPAAPRACRGA